MSTLVDSSLFLVHAHCELVVTWFASRTPSHALLERARIYASRVGECGGPAVVGVWFGAFERETLQFLNSRAGGNTADLAEPLLAAADPLLHADLVEILGPVASDLSL